LDLLALLALLALQETQGQTEPLALLDHLVLLVQLERKVTKETKGI